jgi:hypothetical protein
MLIRKEVDKKMDDIEIKMEEIMAANRTNPATVKGSSRLDEGQGEDSADHMAEFENTVNKEFSTLNEKVIKILAQMKIIRMVQ